MAMNVEEHTVTQSVSALERPFDWKAMESFAEYGAWHTDYEKYMWSFAKLAQLA